VLVEREQAVAALLERADEALAGHGQVVFLAGEAGAGKTALITRLSELVAGRLVVRRGYADDLTTPSPLGAVMEAMPELAPPADVSAADRGRLPSAMRALLANEPTLLLIEDVHWADEATLDVLRFLGRRLAGLPLLAVVTYRPEDAPPRHRLSLVLGDLAGRAGVSRLTIEPLSVAAVAQLVAAAGSALDPAGLHARTSGNPFFVTEAVAAPSDRLPETVRDAVLARVSRMSEGARHVLDAVAVLGARADGQVAARVAGRFATAVDECVSRGMLVPDGASIGFRHELARLAVLETIPPAGRRTLHAAALRELRVSDPFDDRTLAHHAAGCGDTEALVEFARRAAARAARLGAHREAAAQHRVVLQAGRLELTERALVLEQLSYECYLTDQLPEALTARRQAVEAYELAEDAAAVGAATRWLSRLSWFLGQNADSERYAGRAVALLEPFGDGHELAMAYSNVAQLKMLAGEVRDAVAWGRRALEVARRIGDRDVEIHALNNVGTALLGENDSADGRAHLCRSLELALADDAHEHVARAYTNLGSTAAIWWRLGEAEQQLTAGIGYCDERDLDSWSRYMSGWLAGVHAELGAYDRAEQLAATLLAQPDLAPISRIPAAVAAARVRARRGGDAAGLLHECTQLATATGEKQRLVPVACAHAEMAWLTGDPGAVDDALVESAWAAAVAHPNPWELGELCWWLALTGRSRPVPDEVARAAQPFALLLDGAWRAAAGAWRDLGCPLWSAMAAGLDPDLEPAREALAVTTSLGASGTAAALLRTRHERGLPVPRGPRRANRDHPAALTTRELEVLGLVASGLSNAEVAAQLYLSEKTVGHHMSAVLRKLGQPTRSRAIAYALRQGIVRQT
jgi:DNA-binding CsgD family transcriptional regulator